MGADVTSTLLQRERTLHPPSSNGSGRYIHPPPMGAACETRHPMSATYVAGILNLISNGSYLYICHPILGMASKGSFLYISCHESVSPIRAVFTNISCYVTTPLIKREDLLPNRRIKSHLQKARDPASAAMHHCNRKK
jgi:hypothetical protein